MYRTGSPCDDEVWVWKGYPMLPQTQTRRPITYRPSLLVIHLVESSYKQKEYFLSLGRWRQIICIWKQYEAWISNSKIIIHGKNHAPLMMPCFYTSFKTILGIPSGARFFPSVCCIQLIHAPCIDWKFHLRIAVRVLFLILLCTFRGVYTCLEQPMTSLFKYMPTYLMVKKIIHTFIIPFHQTF